MHFAASALAEVRALGIPPADEPVAVLDRPFLPGGVGPCVVDVAADDGLDLVRIEELASVVCYQKFLITDIIRNLALAGISDAA